MKDITKTKEDKEMTFKDINQRFTEKVADYISKGYIIDTMTMSGSQGEVAKVNLTNGSEIIAVVLQNFYNKGKWWLDGFEIVVGKCTDPVEPNSASDFRTLWIDHLEEISREQFYKMNTREDKFGTKEEAEEDWKDDDAE